MARAAKSQGATSEAPANAFIGKTQPPSSEDLDAVLGRPARALWDELLKRLSGELALEVTDWNSYSPKAGWALRVRHKKRNVLYLSPYAGFFHASFILGGKAAEAVRATRMPKRVLKLVEEAPRYPEGRWVRMQVAAADLDSILELARIKLQH